MAQSLCLKVNSSQQRTSSSNIPPLGDDSISQHREAKKAARGRSRGSPVVRNLALVFIEVTDLGVSSSGMSPLNYQFQQTCEVDQKPATMAYHNWKLVVLAKLWTKLT
jgi:hypothetical protein